MIIKRMGFLLAASAIVASSNPVRVFAQQESAVDEVENFFSKEESANAASSPAAPSAPAPVSESPQAEVKRIEIRDVGDLGKLQAFTDIAVISRRFLPKSQRWEAFLGPALNLNDAFFFNFGAQGRFGYYFNERYGIEAIATTLTVMERDVTQDLRDKRGVNTTSFVTPRSYYGADFKWSPIYGKMAGAKGKITPFDHYFSAGLGLTGTNQGDQPTTFHLGTGQIFALTKATALRWDFSWFVFSTKSNVDKTGTTTLYNNLLFTIGWSWFFPEATYR